MILYDPVSGDACISPMSWSPRTCFLMTKLGASVPQKVKSIRKQVSFLFKRHNYHIIDADSITSGKDYLLKIWKLIVSVPIGIAIIDESMTAQTLSNVFYELGCMDSLGKETIIVKTSNFRMPSDFVRTEHISFDRNFPRRLKNFISALDARVDFYATVAEQLERNPLLAIDYYRRAFLISGEACYCDRAAEIFQTAGIKDRAANSVEMLLAGFAAGGILKGAKQASATKD